MKKDAIETGGELEMQSTNTLTKNISMPNIRDKSFLKG